uniref:HHATL n=1 Tax=Angiostrongylus cantonensis TaxID=6313 RepID=A0A0K0DLF7_ANGCA
MSYGRFLPVPLGRWEKGLCWFIWITHSAAAFVIAIVVSRTKLKRNQFWLSESSYIEDAKMDLTDVEWLHFRNTVSREVIDHCLHSVIFFSVIRFVAAEWVKVALSVVGLLIQIHMTSLQCILIITAVSIVVTTLSIYTRNNAIPWVLCLSVVIKGTAVFPFTNSNLRHYLEFNAYMYGAIKILNFCLYMCKNKELKYADIWKEHLAYMGYLPYSSTLIVLFEDFSVQLDKRLNNPAAVIDTAHLRWGTAFAQIIGKVKINPAMKKAKEPRR